MACKKDVPIAKMRPSKRTENVKEFSDIFAPIVRKPSPQTEDQPDFKNPCLMTISTTGLPYQSLAKNMVTPANGFRRTSIPLSLSLLKEKHAKLLLSLMPPSLVNGSINLD